MYKGSCLCGRVRFEIDGQLSVPGSCHCISCRKSTGSAFAAGALVGAHQLRWVSGLDELASHPRRGEELHHYFCRRCGSSLVTAREGAFSSGRAGGDSVGVHLGCLDGNPRICLGQHLNVSQKASWFEICDSLPQFETLPPLGS